MSRKSLAEELSRLKQRLTGGRNSPTSDRDELESEIRDNVRDTGIEDDEDLEDFVDPEGQFRSLTEQMPSLTEDEIERQQLFAEKLHEALFREKERRKRERDGTEENRHVHPPILSNSDAYTSSQRGETDQFDRVNRTQRTERQSLGARQKESVVGQQTGQTMNRTQVVPTVAQLAQIVGNMQDTMNDRLNTLRDKIDGQSYCQQVETVAPPMGLSKSTLCRPRTISELKKLFYIVYNPSSMTIQSFLRNFKKEIASAARKITEREYCVLLSSCFATEERNILLAFCSDDGMTGESPESLHSLLIECFGNASTSISRSQKFYAYGPASRTNVTEILAEIWTLGEAAAIPPKERLNKFISLSPKHLTAEIQLKLGNKFLDPSWEITPSGILSAINSSRESWEATLRFNKNNRDRRYIAKLTANFSVPPPNFAPQSSNLNTQIIDERTCYACLERGHSYKQCPKAALRGCVLCGAKQHLAPTCNIYRPEMPVIGACPICAQNGKTLFHRQSVCQGGAKN